ncbi:MAG TPA: ABC transporter permease [Gemmatimonadaceae bacterium]|jgi:predicted permease
MNFIRAALARIAGVFAGQRNDDDLREELESHLEMETAEYIRRGMRPDDARRKARMLSGGMTAAAEAVREQRGLPWIEGIAADIKYALRALRHSPAFTIVVVLTLALGIGANTAIFSVVRGVLLKPLPNRDGDRLVYFRHSSDAQNGGDVHFSVPETNDFRTGTKAFSGIAEYSGWFSTLRESNAPPTSIDLALVTGNFFEVMGLSPILGRLTRPADDGKGVAPVMVLTHEFWMKHYGGDPAIVGRQVNLDGTGITVIGVVQPAPWFPDKVDVLTNMVVSPHHLSAQMTGNRVHRMTELIGRLNADATLQQARTEVASVQQRAEQEFKDAYDPRSHFRVAIMPYKEALGERARLTLWLLMAAAGFVMIISAANVTNLTVMRSVRREHELVVRAALGAGVGRLRRLLLVENLILALVGATCGIALAVGGVGLLVSFAQRYSTRASDVRLDTIALSFALGLSLLMALMLSFAAFLPKEGGLVAMMSAGMRRMGGSSSKQRVQRGLVVAQVAVSVVLLAGAGLLTRTMMTLSAVDTGLNVKTEQVLTMPVPLLNPAELTPDADARAKQQFLRMREEIRALPGVLEVGIGSTMPLKKSDVDFDVRAEGKSFSVGAVVPHADFRTASPEYFRAAGIPILKGRAFAITDRTGTGAVVIVNQTFADQFFPGEDPIGKRVAWTGEVLKFTPISNEWRTIVGVVRNTQDGGLDAKSRAVIFEPFAQEFTMLGGLVIRSEGSATDLVSSATKIVHRIAPNAPIENVMTVAQIKDQSVAPRRLNATLISLFGLLAVVVAAVGIAGVLAFSVSARTNEIGIRMSLGADRGRVLRMILWEGGSLLVIGLVLGVAAAFVGADAMRGLLFGIAPRDPITLGGVAVLMGLIGLVACWIPALRASRIDPAITMRA